MKPRSMEIFDYLFFGSIIISIFHLIYAWDRMMAEAAAEAGATLAELEPFIAGGAVIGALFGFGITFLLWFFLSVKGSNIARWIFTVLTVLGVLMAGLEMTMLPVDEVVIAAITNALAFLSVVFLFRSDSAMWFSGDAGGWNTSTFE